MRELKTIIILFTCLLMACQPEKKKVFYLNSYHQGYGSSDQTQAGITETLDLKKYDLEVFYLDAKHLNNEELNKKAEEAWQAINAYSPDILLSSDDNAMQSVIVPHLNDIDVPVLFCGINWSAQKYNLPENKVSGMLEVLPVEQSIELIRGTGYEFDTITVLSENSLGEQKNKVALTLIFETMGYQVKYLMVNNFEVWKKSFKTAQHTGNVVFLPTNGAIDNWDHQQAIDFVDQHISVPVFTCDDFMVAYSAFGLTKVAREQGEWVASKAMEIFNGSTTISDIAITKNSKNECFINQSLSDKIGLAISSNSSINCKKFEYDK